MNEKRRIGPLDVSPIGLGCMNLSHAYGTPPPAERAERLLLEALDCGVDLFDTAALYGFGANETLIGRVLSPRHRQRFMLASKCGMQGVNVDGKLTRVIDGRPKTIKATCDDSLRRLQTDVIDLYYLHRWDKLRGVPIEDSVGAMSDLVRQGKIRSIGLSEVSAATLRKAHAVHPIAAVQTEYSLWTRNPEIAVLDACRELGCAFVAFSPLARGYLTGRLTDVTQFEERDIRRGMPRFQADNYAKNLRLLPPYLEIAREVGCTPAQLALAWTLHKAPFIVAIPGTTRSEHLRENVAAAGVALDRGTIARLDELIGQHNVAGARYGAQSESEVDTETF